MENLCDWDPVRFFAALNQQAQSLTELTYRLAGLNSGSNQYEKTHAAQSFGLRNFTHLHSITLPGQSSPVLISVLLEDSVLRPPDLRSLTLYNWAAQRIPGHQTAPRIVLDPNRLIETISSLPPSVQDLHTCYTIHPKAWIQRTELEQIAFSLAKSLDECGRTVHVYEQRKQGSYFPPYLYGEKDDEQKLIWTCGTNSSSNETLI
jgi:hypothetical protein